jgi:hypothetical protein
MFWVATSTASPLTGCDWRKAGSLRIGHDLRNQIGRDRTAGDDIAAESSPFVIS